MRRWLCVVACVSLVLLAACDVHEWPEEPGSVPFYLKLRYPGTGMTLWEHEYDGTDVIERGLGETYDNRLERGSARYVVRACPVTGKQQAAWDYCREVVFTGDVSGGYDRDTTVELVPGSYNIMAWSDLSGGGGKESFYDAADFAGISLRGDHAGNTDYRDAFRGTNGISLEAGVEERVPDTLEIEMRRPLAKFEFITNDLAEFVGKESARVAAKRGASAPVTRVNVEDYKVVFYYVGFMPDTYNMYTDKPVDSSTGVTFSSSVKRLSDKEASLGFDYVFVNGKESAVTVQVGLYNKEGERLSLTEPITVPLKRSHHTVLRGKFLMSNASGGVAIDPDFDGDHNLVLP